jgi:hypothetical protein
MVHVAEPICVDVVPQLSSFAEEEVDPSQSGGGLGLG